jgi:hypothetical protein
VAFKVTQLVESHKHKEGGDISDHSGSDLDL